MLFHSFWTKWKGCLVSSQCTMAWRNEDRVLTNGFVYHRLGLDLMFPVHGQSWLAALSLSLSLSLSVSLSLSLSLSLSVSLSLSHTHIHQHTCTPTYIHTYRRTHIHTHTNTHTQYYHIMFAIFNSWLQKELWDEVKRDQIMEIFFGDNRHIQDIHRERASCFGISCWCSVPKVNYGQKKS